MNKHFLRMPALIGAALTLAGTSTFTACLNQVDDEGGVMGSGIVLGEAGGSAEEAMTAKCAAGTTVKGIDVSYYQGTINWARVHDDGVKFAIIRVSDGNGYRDSKFDANWSGAKAHGVMRGAYQFFRSNQDAVAQADLLIAKIGGKLADGDLPPVIDVESTDGQSAHTIATKVRRWLDRIHEKLGVNGIVYTGPYFWSGSVGGADVDTHPLWVAHYGTQCPLVPPTWTRWTFHQYSSSGSIAGIGGNVDVNHFNGTFAQLKDLTAGPDLPHACVTGHFHGAFCDDENDGSEDNHDRLKRELGVNFHCGDIAGSPAYCGDRKVDRSDAMFVLGAAAKIPLAGHNDAFHDDNDDSHERYLNAAQDYGILFGSRGNVNPDGAATRNTVAVILQRMYALPDVQHDYFFDDDGDADEHIHNAVAAAGLMVGSDDAHHTRNAFKGTERATRSTLSNVAVRAHDRGLVPVWKIPDACRSRSFEGAYCDDDGAGGTVDDRLKNELGVEFSCGTLAGAPAFCPGDEATRADVAYVFGAAADIPLNGHPDAFTDDDRNMYEPYLNAANAYDIFKGFSNNTVKPDDIASRNTLSVVLDRMYQLPDTAQDFFSDDDGSADEDIHNRCAAAGLFSGYDDGHGGKKFDGARHATRNMLATLAVRAHDHALVPVW